MSTTRRNHTYSIALLLLLPLMAALAYASQQADSPGEKVYLSKCAICHGKDGKADTKPGQLTHLATRVGRMSSVIVVIHKGVNY